jgi:FkbM family methyltransferase
MVKYINRLLPSLFRESFFWRVSIHFNRFYKNHYHQITTSTKPQIHIKGLFTDTISQQILFLGYYDASLTKFIKHIAKAGGIFVDVGANIGYCSNLFAKQNKSCLVYSFEPSVQNLALLKHNVALNDLQEQVKILDLAVGDIETEMYFDNGPKEQTGWGHLSETKTGQKVKVITLDHFFKDITKPIDLLKIDVESFDLQVILGAKELLQKGLIKYIIFEYHKDLLSMDAKLSEKAKEIIQLFHQNQYEISKFAAHDYLVQKQHLKRGLII